MPPTYNSSMMTNDGVMHTVARDNRAGGTRSEDSAESHSYSNPDKITALGPPDQYTSCFF